MRAKDKLLALALALALVACGDDGAGGPPAIQDGGDAVSGGDAGPDTTAPDTRIDATPDTTPDTRPDTTPDTAPPADVPSDSVAPPDVLPDAAPDVLPDALADTSSDAGPDPDGGAPDAWAGDATIGGTPLADVAVTWREELALCSGWVENASLEDEIARKVRVTIPPQTRTGLAAAALAGVTLDGVTLARGPFSTDRWDDVAAATSTLTLYRVTDGTNYTALSAVVEHRLGAAGTLLESYSVSRQGGDTTPIVVDGDWEGGYELAFVYVPPGFHVDDGTRLAPCAGRPGLEDAVSVMAGRGAERSVAVVRFWRTQETFAGSYPVELELHRVTFSDEPWGEHDASGFWAQTYSAAHHNWDEAVRLDFRRDLASWYEVFAPLADGTPPVEPALARVTWRDFESWDVEPTIEVVRVGTDGAELPAEMYTPVTGRWARVDTPTLARSVQGCGGAVVTLGWSARYLFQVLTCPREAAPGFSVDAVVPVAFHHDMAAVGQSFGEVREATEDGHPLFTVAVRPEGSPGASEIAIRTDWDAGRGAVSGYVVRVRDADGATVEEFWSGAGTIPRPLAWRTETMRGASADGAVEMTLVREWVGQGVGESSVYAARSFALTFDGATHEVVAWDRLDYTNTHHNWLDELTATTADGWTLHWKFTFSQGGKHEVRAEAPDGSVALPRTELVMESDG